MATNTPHEVQRLLSEGQTPILAFEAEVLSSEFARLGAEQKDLSGLLKAAMEQSSETWHDNAPADAINAQSRIVSGRAGSIMAGLRTGQVIDYPKTTDREITLGSVVGISYAGDEEVEKVVVTGISRTLPKIEEDAPHGASLQAVTLRSPLGAALIGLSGGASVSYEVNGRRVQALVVEVSQLDPKHLKSDQ